jgi:hypothetical protein
VSQPQIGDVLRRFMADVPVVVGIWVVVMLGVAVWWTLVDGTALGESLSLAVTFLPIAIPLSPLLWLRRFASPPDKTVRTVGAGCAWFITTMPLAVGASVALANLLGVN